MKIQGYLALLVGSVAASTTHTSSDEKLTAEVSASMAAAAVTFSFVRGANLQQIQSKQQLNEIAAAAAASRGVTLPVQQTQVLHRHRRTKQEGDQVESFEDLDNDAEEAQKKRSLGKLTIELDHELGKFFKKTLKNIQDSNDERPPLFAQFSMPLLGTGPFGLAGGKPRGGRFRKNGGGNGQRREDEHHGTTKNLRTKQQQAAQEA